MNPAVCKNHISRHSPWVNASPHADNCQNCNNSCILVISVSSSILPDLNGLVRFAMRSQVKLAGAVTLFIFAEAIGLLKPSEFDRESYRYRRHQVRRPAREFGYFADPSAHAPARIPKYPLAEYQTEDRHQPHQCSQCCKHLLSTRRSIDSLCACFHFRRDTMQDSR